MHRHAVRLLLAAVLGSAPLAARADPPVRVACPAAPAVSLRLAGLRAAQARREPLLIVAIGSSSTRGAGAKDPAHTYPAVLQKELSRRLPAMHVTVINRGVDGQDAVEELSRLDRDAVALRPHLVIWQVGANSAIRGLDPEAFRFSVALGTGMLQRAGADVILMDNQRSPRVMAGPHRLEIEKAVQQAATDARANLFPRGAMMDAWQQGGQSYDLFIAPDGLHHNDLGYRCVAEALAAAIVSELTRR
jgi:lysophospholipase L1-like esterase